MCPVISEWIVKLKVVQKRILVYFENLWVNLELAFCLHGKGFECFHLKDDKSKKERLYVVKKT